MSTKLGTYTAEYLAFFGETRFSFLDIYPVDEAKEHIGLDQKISALSAAEALAEMDKYTHPCWCHPELIFADDKKGNEVWLHRRAQ